MGTASPPANRWIHGPVLDLLVGCGGLYVVLFALVPVFAKVLPQHSERLIAPLLVLVLSVPHYGGTLLRVYEAREERRKYTFFTVYATLALFAWFVYGVYDLWVGSLMVTLYLSWSPWHYSGQNYGIALMFLRRRGVSVTTGAKRALYASFVLSFLLALLVMHGTRGAGYDPGTAGLQIIEFIPAGLPAGLMSVLFPTVLVLYLAAVGVAGAWLLRSGSLRDLAPAGLMIVTQALWFAVPFSARHFAANLPDVAGARYILDSMLWVAIAHATQYLWITSYYARRAGAWSGYGRYFAKVMMSGSLVWTVPLLMFAPWALGTHPFGAGLAFLVAALVNLHHFVLDGAIWKLRGGPVASVLIRDRTEAAPIPAPIGTRPRRWLGRSLWAFAALCVAVQGLIYLRSDIGMQWATVRRDVAGAEDVLRDTGWLGGDNARRRLTVAQLARHQGDTGRAVGHLEAGLSLEPDSPLLTRSLGELQLERGELEMAIATLDRAIELEPGHAHAHFIAGTALSRLGRHPEAISRYREALALDPSLALAHGHLGNELLEIERLDDAIRHYRLALELRPDLDSVRGNLDIAIKRKRERRYDDFFGGSDS